VLPPPVINFNFNNACVFDTVNTTNLTNDPNLAQVTYAWLWGDGSPNTTTTNAFHMYQNPGSYQLGLAATNIGGCVDTLYQTVTIHPLPPVFAGNDTTICPGFNIPLQATGAVSYVWETGTQNGGSYIPPTSQMITVVGTDGNGCVNSDSLYVTLHPAAVVDAGPDINECHGISVTITGSGVASYSWDNGLVDGQAFTPPVGIVTYTVTGTDVNGCIDTDQMTLTTWANPGISAGNDQIICEGDSTVVIGNGAVSYVWNNGVVNNDYFIPLVNNTYTVVGTDANGCIGTDDMNITIENAAYPSFNSPVLGDCIPFSFILNNTSTGTPFTNAEWSFGNGATATGAGPIAYTYNTPGCYDIGLTLTTALGCEWDTMIPNYLCAHPLPIADFVPSPMVITDLENVSTMVNQSAGGSFYAWDFGDGTTSTEFEPQHFFPNTTSANFLITLIVYTEYGCTDTTNRVVTLNETQLIYVPNTFTPDGNEYNQTWFPVISADFDPYEFSCYIYDRWGELIWENHNHLVGWDGKRLNGSSMQEGVYTWKIHIKSPYRDERKVFTGHVTLLR
jgi:gliding motility-associated-like protein